MTAWRIAAAVVICLLLASSAFADPDRHAQGLTDPSVLELIKDDNFFATADLTLLLDPAGNSTQHYGPYPSNSPDSGTCGNYWALDTFDRHFTVKRHQRATFPGVERITQGRFVPLAGPSPGWCDSTDGG